MLRPVLVCGAGGGLCDIHMKDHAYCGGQVVKR